MVNDYAIARLLRARCLEARTMTGTDPWHQGWCEAHRALDTLPLYPKSGYLRVLGSWKAVLGSWAKEEAARGAGYRQAYAEMESLVLQPRIVIHLQPREGVHPTLGHFLSDKLVPYFDGAETRELLEDLGKGPVPFLTVGDWREVPTASLDLIADHYRIIVVRPK